MCIIKTRFLIKKNIYIGKIHTYKTLTPTDFYAVFNVFTCWPGQPVWPAEQRDAAAEPLEQQ